MNGSPWTAMGRKLADGEPEEEHMEDREARRPPRRGTRAHHDARDDRAPWRHGRAQDRAAATDERDSYAPVGYRLEVPIGGQGTAHA
jgi:hypothetical protein